MLAGHDRLRHSWQMFHLLAVAALAATTPYPHPKVHDGDTIRCGAERVRLANIDAPELPGSERCSRASRRRLAGSRNPAWCDSALAERSRAALAALVARGSTRLAPIGRDRYGRLLARVMIDGHDAGAYLIARRLARPWR